MENFAMGVKQRSLTLLLATGSVLVGVVLLSVWTRNAADTVMTYALVEGAAADTFVWRDDRDWQPISQPKRVCRVGPEPCFDHYRTTFEYGGQPIGVFVSHLLGSVRVLVNGYELETIGEIEGPVRSLNYEPTYLRVPDAFLTPGTNELQLVVTNRIGFFHRVSPVMVGDQESVRAFSAPLIALVTDGILLSMGVFVAGMIFGVLMYASAQFKPIYLWFVLLCVTAFARHMFFLLSDPSWESVRVSLYFYGSCLNLGVTCALVSCMQGRPRTQLFVALNVVLFVVVSGFLYWMGTDLYNASQAANYFVAMLFVVLGSYILLGTARYYIQAQSPTSAWIVALIIGSFALTLNDVSFTLQGKNALFPLAHLSPLLLVTAFIGYAVMEYRGAQLALGRAEIERAEALHEQKLSIRRDLHDGLSGRMASTLMLARRKAPDVAPLIEESLSELRMLLENLDSAEDTPATSTLGSLRSNVLDLLKKYDLDASWQSAQERDARLSPQSRRALYYAMQEVVHNVVRHAQASSVLFDERFDQNELTLTVTDDGRGIEERGAVSGGGLVGVRKRLEQVGGQLGLTSSVHGTSVEISVPLLEGVG